MAVRYYSRIIWLKEVSEYSADKDFVIKQYREVIKVVDGLDDIYGRLWFIRRKDRVFVYDKLYVPMHDPTSILRAYFLQYDMTTNNSEIHFKRIMDEQHRFVNSKGCWFASELGYSIDVLVSKYCR